jgi:predicted dehydrogenase
MAKRNARSTGSRRTKNSAARRNGSRSAKAGSVGKAAGRSAARTARPVGVNGARRKLRYAVLGQGYISQVAVLPAFEHAAKNSDLVALVSDDRQKLGKLGRKYGVDRLYTYAEYDDCLASGEVDVVYIALPNHLHREYTVRAARAGVHVLCEKPMAVTEEDCRAMIEEVDRNGVKLMIAYRLHFDEANLGAVEIVRSGKIGEPRLFDSVFTMQVEDAENIRLGPPEKGGGPLYDIGIYCINAARYLFRAEPVEVFAAAASAPDPRFRESDEMVSAVLRFPDNRLAAFTCSFGAADVSRYQVVGTKGDLRVDPAYEFSEALGHRLTVNGRTRERSFPKRDQFAAELLYFSDCILRGADPEPSGKEGLADVRVIRALLRSSRSDQPVRLGDFEKRRRPGPSQEIRRPPVEKPRLVGAKTPSEES